MCMRMFYMLYIHVSELNLSDILVLYIYTTTLTHVYISTLNTTYVPARKVSIH